MAVGWSSKDSATQLTSITTVQYFDDEPTLEPNQLAHVQIRCDYPATPTDELIVRVFTTLDTGTGEEWDDTPIQSFTIPNGTDPDDAVISTVVGPGIQKFRIGVLRDGTTDTITSADMYHKIGTMS